MNRKWRLILPALFLMGWLLATIPASTPGAAARPAPQELRGVWMTGNDMATLRNRSKMQRAVSTLGKLNFNTIYPVVWNGGYAYYPSDVTRERGLQSFTFKGLDGQDILAELIAEGHANKLRVIPWFEFGFMTDPGSALARKHPSWLTQKQDGGLTSISAAGEVSWLNPLRPEVQEFITDLVMEVVSQYDGDGIQFDDHMSLPSEFGYDPYTLAAYKRETGKSAPSNPRDSEWLRWRADKLTAFMTSLQKKIKAEKPDHVISISPNYYAFAYKLQLQDWLKWVRKEIVDELIVQVYRPDLASFQPQLIRPEILESKKAIPTAVGIMTGQRTKPVPMDLIQSQVLAARQEGLGVAFFYFESLWESTGEKVEDRLTAFQALFS